MSRVIELLRLFKTCSSIIGRKKLQKMVFILKELGNPLSYRYSYHLHGVFSAELKAEIDTLVAQQLIEQSEDDAMYGEFHQYKYASTGRLSKLLKIGGYHDQPNWSGVAKQLNLKSPQELEAISTIMFLERQGCSEVDLKSRFEQLKPQLALKYDAAKRFIAGVHTHCS